MVNRVILIGNLGRDPEVRRLENGAAVAKFTIATSDNYKDASGTWQEQTEWHEVVAWREQAEKAESSFKKGMTVYVEGKLTHRKYTDKDNIERYRTEIVANYIRHIKSPGGGANPNYFPSAENEPVHSARKAANAAGSDGGSSEPYNGSGSDADSMPTVEPVMEAAGAKGADDLPF